MKSDTLDWRIETTWIETEKKQRRYSFLSVCVSSVSNDINLRDKNQVWGAYNIHSRYKLHKTYGEYSYM